MPHDNRRDRETFLRRKRKTSGEKRSGDDGHRGLGSASNHHALAAQLLAELGKSEMGRGVCLEKEVTFDLEGALSEQVELGVGRFRFEKSKIIGRIGKIGLIVIVT